MDQIDPAHNLPILSMRITQLIIFLSALIPPALAVQADEPDDKLPIVYSVSISGIKDSGLIELLRSVSDSVDRVDYPPPTRLLLEDMARDDTGKMEKVLRARGFYDGTVTSKVKDKKDRYEIIFSVTPGSPFSLKTIRIIPSENIPETEAKLPSPAEIGLKGGQTGTAKSIISAGGKLLSLLRDQGYPFSKISDRKVIVDFATRTMEVIYQVDPGGRMVFGKSNISGLVNVHEGYVLNLITWKEGEVYSPKLMQEFRDRLSRDGLFSIVQVSHQSEPPEDDRLAINIKLQERDRFSIGISAGYQTDRGFGGSFTWEDRSLFGGGELLQVGTDLSQEVYTGKVSLKLPQLMNPDQDLVLGVYLTDDNPDAYYSRRLRGATSLLQDLGGGISLSGGAAITQDGVEQLDKQNDYTLISAPLAVKWTIGPTGDPTADGASIDLTGEPFYDLHRYGMFTKVLLSNNIYLNVPGISFLSVAARAALGSIQGSGGESDIPADLRFYAGGAGSIRGYAYQSVSPLVGKDPIGGRSLLTFSLELEAEVISGIGVAGFIDGGSAFTDSFPSNSNELLYGAGGGLRYFSPIGPIGLDIGFPLHRRIGIDDSFQIYVSIVRTF
ncbi:MAG TPA: hypothetical protein ENH12_06460 [Proteobacteria bacterium]|nr:hypothetical protein [Pseudomonadota bacterium]